MQFIHSLLQQYYVIASPVPSFKLTYKFSKTLYKTMRYDSFSFTLIFGQYSMKKNNTAIIAY